MRNINCADAKKMKIISFNHENNIFNIRMAIDYSSYNKHSLSNIRAAIEDDSLNEVEYLVSLGTNVRNCDDYAICLASMHGRLEIIKYLVSLGANVRARKDEPIRVASLYGYLEVVKYLVLQGANIHCASDYVIRIALCRGDLNIVKYVISLSIDVNSLCCQMNKLVSYLCKNGEFDYAIKLSKHKDFTDEAMKNSLVKIEKNRKRFLDNMRINYFDTLIICSNKN